MDEKLNTPESVPSSTNKDVMEEKVGTWIETKREFEVDAQGNKVLIKTSSELANFRKRDYVDIILRGLPLIAIITTLVLFSKQQANEINRQTRLFEIETYTNTTTTVQILGNSVSNTQEYQKTKEEFLFKLCTKIKFLNYGPIVQRVDTIRSLFEYYWVLTDGRMYIDSMANILLNIDLRKSLDTQLIIENERLLKKTESLFNTNYWKLKGLLKNNPHTNKIILNLINTGLASFDEISGLLYPLRKSVYSKPVSIYYIESLTIEEVCNSLKIEIARINKSLDVLITERLNFHK